MRALGPLIVGSAGAPRRGRLFTKYVLSFIGLVTVVLLINGALDSWFSYRQARDAAVRLQGEKAEAAAQRIEGFVAEIERQIGWTTHAQWAAGTVEQRRFDYVRLLRQVPAITELIQLDAQGREQLKVSRLAMDVIGSGADHSAEPRFTEAAAKRIWFSPVYFRKESEPYMTMAVARSGRNAGVTVAEVNLKLIWDVVSTIKAGKDGYAYVVDREGRLIAHPDISLVLRNTDLSALPQVAAAQAALESRPQPGQGAGATSFASDRAGQSVLSAYAPIPRLGWLVFVELPLREALAPLYNALIQTLGLLAGGLALSGLAGLVMARKMVGPIRHLETGATRLGGGDLGHRIDVRTGDELERLADRFNAMAGQLQESYADLERKVEDRTRELSESLEQQTATSNVLQVISRSTFDLQTVLDTLVASAARLCGADKGVIFQRDGDLYRLAANYGFSREAEAYAKENPLRPGRGSTTGRVALEGRTVHVPDVLADPEYLESGYQATFGYRTNLGVPLLRGGTPIGVFVLTREVVNPFTDKQIELVTTFADQAVIAIENVRLFDEVQARTRELQESLEYQTATSDVLNVISRSPNDLQPVLDAIVETAHDLCQARYALFFKLGADGLYHLAASKNADALRSIDWLRAHPIAKGDGTATGLAALERRTIHFPDALADPRFTDFKRQQQSKARTQLAVPLMRADVVIGVIFLARTEVKPFTDRQVNLVTTFADQAVIAINNVGLFDEVQARTRELSAALEQQTATSEVLQVINASPGDLAPVFDAMLAKATQLCNAKLGILWTCDGEAFTIAAERGLPSPRAVFGEKPMRPGPDTGLGRVAREKRVVHIPDIVDDLYKARDPMRTKSVEEIGARTWLGVPLLKEGTLLGAFTIYRGEVRPFSDKEIALLASFADQAVIAIENVRLFDEVQARTRELQESLEYQTATSDVLNVISRSPSELQPVLDAIVATAARLCRADMAAILKCVDDKCHVAATNGMEEEHVNYLSSNPLAIDRGSVSGRVVLERSTLHVPDVLADPEFNRLEWQSIGQQRTALAVPLLREGEPLGVIALMRGEVRPFTDKEVELVTTFADQAVIAIENTRLFEEVQARTRELQESLEYQTATGDVLNVISRSPSQIQPVLDAIVQTAARLCSAEFALVFKCAGDTCHLAAISRVEEEHAQYLSSHPVTIDRGSLTGRVALDRCTIHIPDILADPGFNRFEWQRVGKQRTVLGVPLLREDTLLGVIILARTEVKPFTAKQVELVTTFADQAVIAIENTRLFEEVQARTRELAQSVDELRALGETGQAVSSTLDLSNVIDTVAVRAMALGQADGFAMFRYRRSAREFSLWRATGLGETHVETIQRIRISEDETTMGRSLNERQPIIIPDLTAVPNWPLRDAAVAAGMRTVLIVPLIRAEKRFGTMVLLRRGLEPFSQRTIDLMQTFASQSVLAIQNARLFREIEEKGHQLEVASQHKSQFLANMSHELRTPLNAVLGYTELLIDNLYGKLPDKAQGVLERIQTNGQHLLALINDVLDLSKIEAGQLTLALDDYALPSLVQSVVTVAEPLARAKGLALRVAVPEGLPFGRGDERRLTQVLLNLVGNAIKFTDAGSVEIAAGTADGHFELAVTDTGPGIGEADRTRIFEAFQQVDNTSTRKKGGTGLGLAISKKIVEMHGGSIVVESVVGQGSTFRIAVPIRVDEVMEAA